MTVNQQRLPKTVPELLELIVASQGAFRVVAEGYDREQLREFYESKPTLGVTD
ncbi:MAG: hypothetical protein H8K06_20695 [Nitrospira sp.]|nr:hypothetical protein [Nitrospira sp.]